MRARVVMFCALDADCLLACCWRRAAGWAQTVPERQAANIISNIFFILYVVFVTIYFTITSIEAGNVLVIPSGPTAVTRLM